MLSPIIGLVRFLKIVDRSTIPYFIGSGGCIKILEFINVRI